MEHKYLETEYLDVLQNLEAAIIRVDIQSDDLTDLEVIDAIDYLIRSYSAEANGRSAPFVRLSPLKRQIVDAVKATAEWRMGRTGDAASAGALPAAEPDIPGQTQAEELEASVEEIMSLSDIFQPQTVTLEVVVACLRRIRLSAKYWNSSNGRRGYLEFVQPFVA